MSLCLAAEVLLSHSLHFGGVSPEASSDWNRIGNNNFTRYCVERQEHWWSEILIFLTPQTGATNEVSRTEVSKVWEHWSPDHQTSSHFPTGEDQSCVFKHSQKLKKKVVPNPMVFKSHSEGCRRILEGSHDCNYIKDQFLKISAVKCSCSIRLSEVKSFHGDNWENLGIFFSIICK